MLVKYYMYSCSLHLSYDYDIGNRKIILELHLLLECPAVLKHRSDSTGQSTGHCATDK